MHKDKLDLLLQLEAQRQLEQLKAQQVDEVLLLMRLTPQQRSIEQKHLEELTEFNAVWDERVTQVVGHGKALEDGMLARHREEKAAKLQDIAVQFPAEAKPSSELLNMISIGEKMVKMRRYDEAESVKKKVGEMKEKARAEWEKRRKEKVDAQMATLVSRQQVELESLRHRVKMAVEEQRKLRSKELEKYGARFGYRL